MAVDLYDLTYLQKVSTKNWVRVLICFRVRKRSKLLTVYISFDACLWNKNQILALWVLKEISFLLLYFANSFSFILISSYNLSFFQFPSLF